MFPPTGVGLFTFESFEDDAETDADLGGDHGGWRVRDQADRNLISVRALMFGIFPGPMPRLISSCLGFKRLAYTRSLEKSQTAKGRREALEPLLLAGGFIPQLLKNLA